ncbi:MAG: AraC family transcriptional regulator, partial [Planctomycetota bacterium]
GSQPKERYRLPRAWCLHLYRYHARLWVDGKLFSIQPGSVTVLPPDVELDYRFEGRSEHTYVHFNPAAREGGAGSRESTPRVKELSHWEPSRFALLEATLREAVGWFGGSPRRAEVRVWDVLWQVVSGPDACEPRVLLKTAADRAGEYHGLAMERLTSAIELRLAEPIRVDQLLDELGLGLSYNQTLRVFRQHTGGSIIAYIRRRRVERARHLLVRTSIPIKVVALQVGVPDLQAFNKLIRHTTGLSPRALRERG